MELKKALINGKILSGYENYENHALLIDGRQISGIVSNTAIPAGYQKIDLNGGYICPGLIDLQVYGAGNHLFSADLTRESLENIEQTLLQQGCTSFNLTLATNTLEVFREAIAVFAAAQPRVALGLHLEGPFLNAQKRGAHPEELIRKAELGTLKDLLSGNGRVVTMITVAPECMDLDCTRYLNEQGILISAGHSAATFTQALAAFEMGIPAVTHLWNAMSPLHHRDLGLPGATMQDERACASIIVDGVHVSYPAVKLSKAQMGERLFLITDAVAACSKGIYQHVRNGDHYTLPDGTLSGAALSMLQAIKNCVEQVGIPLQESVRMATAYPARLMGRSDIGNLDTGSRANVLAFDNKFEVQNVWFQGEEISRP